MLISAQVSFGSQPQYRPQLSLAHIPPRKFPIVNMIKPTVNDSSLIIVSSFNFSLIISLFFFVKNIIKINDTIPKIIPKVNGP